MQSNTTIIAMSHQSPPARASAIIISSEIKSGEGGNASTATIPTIMAIAPTLLILI